MAQIAIIGLGAVGCSLGMALRRSMQTPDGKPSLVAVVGYDPDRDMQDLNGRKDGSFDRPAWDYASAVREASFVILALPTPRVRDALQAIAPHLPAGATVTDTASGKALVLRWAREYLPEGVSFVGGHPLPRRVPAPLLTEDEVTDEPADPDLFQGAPYCIVPLPTATEAAVNQVISLAEAIGARPYFTDAYEHDSFQAAIHDLPVLMSYALTRVLGESPSWRDMSPLAGGAFREASRMASSDPLANRADLVANREHILGWLDRYQAALHELRGMLEQTSLEALDSGAGQELGAALIAGRNTRTGWLNPNAALTPAQQDLRDQMKQARQGGIMRTMFGGFLTDRLGGRSDADRDKEREQKRP
jgi:prephenate dehydrogenase